MSLSNQEIQAILDAESVQEHELEDARKRLEAKHQELDFVTTRDVINHFGVSPATVYQWLARGWLTTQEEHVHGTRYRISIERFNEIDRAASSMLPELKRFVPRLLYGKGR